MSALAMAHESKGGSAQAARKAAGNLRINQPDDAFEQEADRVAEEVMAGPRRGPAWSLSRVSMGPPLQRQCACGGKCEDCKQEKVVQRQASGGPAPAIAPAIVDRVLESHGQPLDRATREFFEPRFGCDFSKVRIHADARAAESATAVHAQAFAVGDRIVFAAGHYAPHTSRGRRLLAHELVHTVQQGRSAPATSSDFRHDNRAASGPDGRAALGAAISRNSQMHVARNPGDGPESKPAGNPPAPVRVVRLDNNVIAEIGRGNANVANTLRKLAADPSVKVQMSKGVYLETTRVTGDMLAARKALIQKLNIEIVDEPIASRAPLYQNYAESKDFPTHGQPKVTGGENATLEDIPHIASAAAGGKDVELWTFDGRVQANAPKLGVKIAPESQIAIYKNVPDNYQNILRLVPEVVPSDITGAGPGGTGKGGGGTPPPAPPAAGGGPPPAGGAGGISLAPLAEGTQTRPPTSTEIIAGQKALSQLASETAESGRLLTRVRAYGAIFGGLMQIYTAFSTVADALKFSADGTMFGEAQGNASKLVTQSASDLNNAIEVTGGVSLFGAVASVSDAGARGDSGALFDLSSSLGDFSSACTEAAGQMKAMSVTLELRVKGLQVMADYFKGKIDQVDPLAGAVAGTLPQAQAFMTWESIDLLIGPLMTAGSNYKKAADTLSYFGDYTGALADKANSSAWTLVLRKLAADTQKAAAAQGQGEEKGAHTTPAGVHLDPTPRGFPSEAEQKGKVPCPTCHSTGGDTGPRLTAPKKKITQKEIKAVADWINTPPKPAADKNTHDTPAGVHLDTTPRGFPTEEEQKGKSPCPTCHDQNPSAKPFDKFKPMDDSEILKFLQQ